MRSIGASYLVGTPKGRLNKLAQSFLAQPWARVRDGVQVQRLATDEDVCVLAQSDARIGKERGCSCCPVSAISTSRRPAIGPDAVLMQPSRWIDVPALKPPMGVPSVASRRVAPGAEGAAVGMHAVPLPARSKCARALRVRWPSLPRRLAQVVVQRCRTKLPGWAGGLATDRATDNSEAPKRPAAKVSSWPTAADYWSVSGTFREYQAKAK